jgi:hypothetical protein
VLSDLVSARHVRARIEQARAERGAEARAKNRRAGGRGAPTTSRSSSANAGRRSLDDARC